MDIYFGQGYFSLLFLSCMCFVSSHAVISKLTFLLCFGQNDLCLWIIPTPDVIAHSCKIMKIYSANGVCQDGKCVCRPVLDPYNNTRDINGVAWDPVEEKLITEGVGGWKIELFEITNGWEHPDEGKYIRSYSGNFAGEDCSYIVPFAEGVRRATQSAPVMLVMSTAVVALWLP